jgi:hypothetical protein
MPQYYYRIICIFIQIFIPLLHFILISMYKGLNLNYYVNDKCLIHTGN